MKTLRVLFMLCIVALTLPSVAQNIITNDEVFVTISGETTREELAEIRQQLLQAGIDFQY